MRDVSAKSNTLRIASARAVLKASPQTLQMIRENRIPKGDPIPVSKVAAIQAAKNTHQILPYCHPVPVDYVGVEFELLDDRIVVTTTVKAIYKTGVEMEALTAASVAVLNLYDMMKMLDEQMEIESTVLLEKTGGKSDFRQPFTSRLRAGVIVMSDSVASGKKADRSGQLIVDRLKSEGLSVEEYQVIPDDPEAIRALVLRFVDEAHLDLVVTTGGTGISPTDKTPEALAGVFSQELPGVAETMRAYGQHRTPYAMLSRSQAGTRGQSLILVLPGSVGGVQDSLDALFPAILHGFKMMWGGKHPQAAEAVAEETVSHS